MLTYENIYLFAFMLPVYQLLFYTVQLLRFNTKKATHFYTGLLLLCMLFLLIANAVLHLDVQLIILPFVYIVFHPLIFCVFPVFLLSMYSWDEIKRSKGVFFRILIFGPPVMFLFSGLLFYGLSHDAHGEVRSFFSVCSGGLSRDARVLVDCLIFPVVLALQVFLGFSGIRNALLSEWQLMRRGVRLMVWQKPGWVYAVMVSLVVFVFTLLLSLLFFEMRDLVAVLVLNTLLLASGGMVGLIGMRYRTLELLEGADEENNKTIHHTSIDALPEATETENKDLVPGLLSDNEAEALGVRLEKLMQDKRPYLQPGYALDDLCHELQVDRRVMTWFLNNVLKKNFYSVINAYRIKQAIVLLQHDADRYTIDSIARMVCFRSKSSFYSGFKRQTGMTPHVFLKSNTRV